MHSAAGAHWRKTSAPPMTIKGPSPAAAHSARAASSVGTTVQSAGANPLERLSTKFKRPGSAWPMDS